MDWTTITAALAGGGIGILGETVGRRASRRQAREDRAAALEDEEVRHVRELEEVARQEVRAAGRLAVENILAAIRDNAIPLVDPVGLELDDKEVVKRAWNLWSALFINGLLVDDAELRGRLLECEQVLDTATTPNLSLEIPLREIVRIARVSLYAWIGPWLRGEPIPERTKDWHHVTERVRMTHDQWREWLAGNGYVVDPSEGESDPGPGAGGKT